MLTFQVHHLVSVMKTQMTMPFCDGDDVTFSFHTYLVYGIDFGGVASSLVGALALHHPIRSIGVETSPSPLLLHSPPSILRELILLLAG
jgi:hypothetical protein